MSPVTQVLRWIVPSRTGSPLDCPLSHRFSAGLSRHIGSPLDCPLSRRFSAGLSPVTRVLRWIVPRDDSQTTQAIIFTDPVSLLQNVKSGIMEWELSPDWPVSMFDVHLRRLLWMCCSGHAGVKGNDRTDRLAGKAAVTSGLRCGKSEVLRNLRYNMGARSQSQ